MIAAEVVALPEQFPTLSDAVEAFFSDKDLSPNACRTYRQALNALVGDLGPNLLLSQLTGPRIRAVLTERWGESAPATWNARLTALQSFVRYCRRNGWLAGSNPLAAIDRKRVPRDQTKAIPYDDLHALWTRPAVGLREKTLWRMLYETAARSNEILALNIEDLDLARKRAAVVGKGGHREVSRLGVRRRSAAAPIPLRSTPRTGIRHQPPTQPSARRSRPMPRHRARATLLQPGMVSVQGGQRRMDTPPATTLSPHPPRPRKESPQSFSRPKADTTTPAPSPDTPNQASKP